MTREEIDALEQEADDLLAALQAPDSVEASTSPDASEPPIEADGAAVERPLEAVPADPADTPASEAVSSPAESTETVPLDRYKHAERRMHEATREAAETGADSCCGWRPSRGSSAIARRCSRSTR